MRSIIKTFPGVRALSDVNLTVAPGEVHAICGENGAGKSTLMKVLSGVYPHGSYEGEILFEGEACAFKDIRASEQRGIVIIHQELALVPVPLHRGEHLPRQRARHARDHQLARDAARTPPSCCERVGLEREPADPDRRHRRGQAAARGDRQGAVQEGEAAHPGRADRRAERRGQRQAARPHPGAQGAGHHLHHHLAQAQRDRAGRRLRHDPARRPDHRDARREGGGDHRGPDHPRHGRPRPGPPLPRAHADEAIGDVARRSRSRTGPSTTRSTSSARWSTACRSTCGAARSSASPG